MKSALRNIQSKAKKLLVEGANTLRKNESLKKIAGNNPKLAASVKKVAKRIIGSAQESIMEEPTYKDNFNPDMAENYAEHVTLLQDNKINWYEKEVESVYERHEDDPRVVAIYLPQFHPFKENDKAWGKGFTEWTNVTASIPRFVGQQQPVLPSDLGFYDLRLPSVIKQQIDLAKKYGIYGFQFYYYWFSGKKVMDLPINTILKNSDWDFHFSICWANENWTRKWDGGENDIIFEQKDNDDDPLNFIKDVAPILNDKRYILENGKPILTVYRVELLNDPKRYVDAWRKYFKETFNKELWLIGHTYSKDVDPISVGFDATMDFTPIGSLQPTLKPWVDDRKYLTEEFRANRKLLDMRWMGQIIDFRFLAKQEIANLKNNHNLYKTISPSWSNEARRKGNDGYTFYYSSPELFTHWLDKILNFEINTQKHKSPLVLINAWNEWAEAAMLEPSQHVGHSSLIRIAETLSKYSHNKSNQKAFPFYKFSYSKDANLAIVLHLYYPEMLDVFYEKLKKINVPFDVYVSVPQHYADIQIKRISNYHKNTNVVVVPNRGRDVLPFLTIMSRVKMLNNYEFVLKLHTKKSKHRTDGDRWFTDLLDQMIPDNTTDIIKVLSQPATGIIGPDGHVVSLSRHMGGNRDTIIKLLGMITEKSYEEVVDNEAEYPFIGSTMFWCRVDYLDPLLSAFFTPSDFQSENGQIDNTTAHAIERILGKILHKIGKRKMYVVNKNGKVSEVKDSTAFVDKYEFAD